MTNLSVEALFLEAVSAGIHGKRVAWTALPPERWLALCRLAEAQKLLPILIDAACDCADAATDQVYSSFQRAARLQVAEQARKDAAFFPIYAALTRAGIPVLLVKGSLCRAIYPNGGLRISSDEDLLVEESRFDEACRILTAAGLRPLGAADPDRTEELEWKSPNGPVFLELHRRLSAPDSGPFDALQSLFSDAFSRARSYPLEGGTEVLSLSPHDHLLFLLLHAMKHFIRSGVGLRQICDVGLWAARWGEEIDWELLRRQTERVHGEKFCAAIFAASEQKLGIALDLPPLWRAELPDPEPLLRDCLAGGIYGTATGSRSHTARITQAAVAARGRKKRSGLLAAVFPSARSLEDDYPELKAHPARLPLVWQKRVFRYLKQAAASRGDSPAETVRLGKQRLALLRTYGILEEKK